MSVHGPLRVPPKQSAVAWGWSVRAATGARPHTQPGARGRLCAVCRMRWSVVGYPRVPWEACGIFDGVSEFRLDSNGKIYEVRLARPHTHARCTRSWSRRVRLPRCVSQLASWLALGAAHACCITARTLCAALCGQRHPARPAQLHDLELTLPGARCPPAGAVTAAAARGKGWLHVCQLLPARRPRLAHLLQPCGQPVTTVPHCAPDHVKAASQVGLNLPGLLNGPARQPVPTPMLSTPQDCLLSHQVRQQAGAPAPMLTANHSQPRTT